MTIDVRTALVCALMEWRSVASLPTCRRSWHGVHWCTRPMDHDGMHVRVVSGYRNESFAVAAWIDPDHALQYDASVRIERKDRR